uniref:Uncharacterized protein n=1 Tax=Anguilla anguilla TaxID=7936 RepID=A0A0E9PS49_ANGAN
MLKVFSNNVRFIYCVSECKGQIQYYHIELMKLIIYFGWGVLFKQECRI